jgi:hypothetical protein
MASEEEIAGRYDIPGTANGYYYAHNYAFYTQIIPGLHPVPNERAKPGNKYV